MTSTSASRLALLASGAFHLGGLLVLYLVAPRPRAAAPDDVRAPRATDAVEVAPPPRPAPQVVDVEVMALAGRAGGAGPRAVRVHARHPRPAAPTPALAPQVAAPAPEVAPAPDVAPALEVTPAPEVASAPEVAPIAAPAAAAVPGGGGHGAAGDGPGAGDGGDGDGAGSLALRSGEELHARVIGEPGASQDEPGDGPPFISNKEATALRTRDYFPRLSEAAWPYRRPYMVSLDVCVAANGHVTAATLRSAASGRLDAIVQAAVSGWRYRPRLVDGQPAPFCHGVVIKYERW